jgi:hypothetical protein
MGGGLLNLVAYGNLNVIVNGNPSKTFFKTTYAKYTNFGLQKFRIDYSGLRNLRLNEDSVFTFRVPRYADLLMDTFVAVTLPNIWSPVLNEKEPDNHIPYEFKWIDNIGAQLIRRIKVTVGGQLIQEFTGQYLLNMVNRDFSEEKKKVFNELIGNGNQTFGSELTNPAFYGGNPELQNGNRGLYPNATYVSESQGGPQPSISARTIYIPINIWSTLSSKMAFPLVSLQYNYLQIEIECRPVTELFVIRDVLNPDLDTKFNRGKYIRADQNVPAYQFYRFLHPPPNNNITAINNDVYDDKRTDWFTDIHLVSTYAFLSDDEVRLFAAKPQKYLIREVHEYDYHNVTGNQRTKIYSLGLVANWMWYFQRDDVDQRNEWSNYTNWEYNFLPYNSFGNSEISFMGFIPTYGHIRPQNQRDIMMTWALLFDGKYRENPFPAEVYGIVEKYIRNAAYSLPGLYCYNFCLDTNPFNLQPSGAVNLSKFSIIEFEYSTYTPPADANAQTLVVCDDDSNPIGVNKPTWRLYDYNYNLHLMEERYNILIFESGNAGLMFSR